MIDALEFTTKRKQLVKYIEVEAGIIPEEISNILLSTKRIPVTLIKNNETGVEGFAVALKEYNEYWLGFFPKYKEAIGFCYDLNLKIE